MKDCKTPLGDYIDLKFKGNKSKAAKFFEVDRTTLYSWLSSGLFNVSEIDWPEIGVNEVWVFKNIKIIKSVDQKEV